MIRALSFLGLVLLPLTLVAAPKVQVVPDHETGVYKAGEKVTWSVNVADGEKAAAGEVSLAVLKGGFKEIRKQTVSLDAGKASVSATLDKPGVLLLKVTYTPDDGKE